MRVHLRTEPTPDERTLLQAELPRSVQLTSNGPLQGETDVLVNGRPSPQELLSVRQALVIPYAGLPRSTRAHLLAHRPDLPVYNLHHNAHAAAEHAVALLLAAARRLLPVDRALRAGDWRDRYGPDPGVALAGRTAVVLGMGAIGRRVAVVLGALGMTVEGVRRTARDGWRGAEDLEPLLRQADVLVVCLPHTEQTEGLLDAERLGLLPWNAVLVNVGRAQVIDERALFECLRDGRIHSAGLDVWYRYPGDEAARTNTPVSDLPFHALDNVVLSPHRAGHGPGVEARRWQALGGLLAELERGAEPASRVDVVQGY
ncbi:MAG: hydroxyacid dehydrogenase [Alphaproteobacteria bacterium]|nr:hydroxyacid dehydrogenase [Alphaproteobacteria bacterium]